MYALDSDALRQCLGEYPLDNPLPLAGQSSRDLAYLIYTSGSTGQPKGAAIEQRSVINLALQMIRRCTVDTASRVLQFASQSFDAAVLDWTMALLAGASLHVCSDTLRTSPEQLQQYLLQQRITHALLPPALLPLLDSTRDYAFVALIVGGEACDAQTVRSWARRYRFFNAYGPTEAAVCAKAGRIDTIADAATAPPIRSWRREGTDP